MALDRLAQDSTFQDDDDCAEMITAMIPFGNDEDKVNLSLLLFY